MIRNEHIIKAYKPYFECIKDVVAHATKPLADKKSELTIKIHQQEMQLLELRKASSQSVSIGADAKDADSKAQTIQQNIKSLRHQYSQVNYQSNVPLEAKMAFDVVVKAHEMAKKGKLWDYAKSMREGGYRFVTINYPDIVPQDNELKSDTLYLYVAINPALNSQYMEYVLRFKAISPLTGVPQDIILGNKDIFSDVIAKLVGRQALIAEEIVPVFQQTAKYGYLNGYVGYQFPLEDIRERFSIRVPNPENNEAILLESSVVKAVTDYLKDELDLYNKSLYNELDTSLTRGITLPGDGSEFANEKVKVRYLKPLLGYHLQFLNRIKIEFFDHLAILRFAKDGDLTRLISNLALDKQIRQAKLEYDKAMAAVEYIQEIKRKYILKAQEKFRKKFFSWMGEHKNELPTNLKNISAKEAEKFVENIIEATDWSENCDVTESVRCRRRFVFMRDVDGNSLLHFAMEKYGEISAYLKLGIIKNSVHREKDLQIMQHIINLLEFYGCYPYWKNDKGENAYQFGSKKMSEVIKEKSKDITPDNKFENHLPDWPLLRIGLQRLSTFSPFSTSLKKELMKYVEETESQLTGTFSAILRLFLDLAIKELRRMEMSVLMEALYQGQRELTDQELILRMRDLLPIVRRGKLGRSSFCNHMENALAPVGGLMITFETAMSDITKMNNERVREVERQNAMLQARNDQANKVIASLKNELKRRDEKEIRGSMKNRVGTALASSSPIVSTPESKEKRQPLKADRVGMPALIQTLKVKNSQFKIGKAHKNNDCFFDSVAQALQEVKGIPEQTAKSLRTMCYQYVNDAKDTKFKNWFTGDDGVKEYAEYKAQIQYTQAELNDTGKTAIWGVAARDGQVLCQKFNIRLHAIDIDEEGKTKHQLITATTIDSIKENEADYNDPNIIHVACYKRHFVPLVTASLYQRLYPVRKVEVPGGDYPHESSWNQIRDKANEKTELKGEASENIEAKLNATKQNKQAILALIDKSSREDILGFLDELNQSSVLKPDSSLTLSFHKDNLIMCQRKTLFGDESKIHNNAKIMLAPILRQHSLEITASYDNEDGFFDSIAQALKRKNIKIPVEDQKYGPPLDGHQKLRSTCSDYAKILAQQSDEKNWVKNEFLKNAKRHIQAEHLDLDDEAVKKEALAQYQDYLLRLASTCAQVEEYNRDKSRKVTATIAYPEIEGRIIAELLKVKIQVVVVRNSTTIIEPTYKLIDSGPLSTDNRPDYKDDKTIFVVEYNGRYVPLLPKIPSHVATLGLHAQPARQLGTQPMPNANANASATAALPTAKVTPNLGQ